MRPWWCVVWAGCWLPEQVLRDKIAATPAIADSEPAPDSDPTDDSEPADDSDPPTDSEPLVDSEPAVDTELPLPECADLRAAHTLGAPLATGDHTLTGNRQQASCSTGFGGGDSTIAWRADRDACLVFHTAASAGDTVLSLLDACDGAELACNDDDRGADTLTSAVHYPVRAGDELLIVVDAYDGASEALWSLEVEEGVDLPIDADLGSATGALITGENGSADPTLVMSSSCGDRSTHDLLYTWTAPAAGTWRFTDEGTDFDAVLSVHPRCGTHALACYDSVLDGFEEVTVQLDAGETVVVRLASAYSALFGIETGSFELQVEDAR